MKLWIFSYLFDYEMMRFFVCFRNNNLNYNFIFICFCVEDLNYNFDSIDKSIISKHVIIGKLRILKYMCKP